METLRQVEMPSITELMIFHPAHFDFKSEVKIYTFYPFWRECLKLKLIKSSAVKSYSIL